jgi:transposase
MSQRQYKEGIERQQAYLLPPSIEEYVIADNPVRAIDTYVDSLDLGSMGFKNAGGELSAGQPAFDPKTLMKLYLYGYLHRVRSSRQLEAECGRNLEVMWLVRGLRPGYKTIANFRKDDAEAIKKINRDFVQMCKELELFGGELVGIDGSFFRGNVSKGSIYTAERLKHSLGRIEKDIADYLEEMSQADQQGGEAGSSQSDADLGAKLEALRKRQSQRQQQLEQLKESGASQIAEVDRDARLLNKGGGTIAGYNVQTAIDAKYHLMVTQAVTQDGNDQQQLAPMALAAKAELGVERLEVTLDQGYFNAEQIRTCEQNGITPYVPEPDKQAQTRQQGRFTRDEFQYDAPSNSYRCPAGQVLPYVRTQEKRGKQIWVYQPTAAVCQSCPLKGGCLPKKTAFRSLTRWEHEAVIEAHRARMAKEGQEKKRQRSALCEHPFGTLKLWCGWRHFLVRGLDKVRAEMSLLMLCYNFKRVLNILGLSAFRAYCLLRRSNPTLAMS